MVGYIADCVDPDDTVVSGSLGSDVEGCDSASDRSGAAYDSVSHETYGATGDCAALIQKKRKKKKAVVKKKRRKMVWPEPKPEYLPLDLVTCVTETTQQVRKLHVQVKVLRGRKDCLGRTNEIHTLASVLDELAKEVKVMALKLRNRQHASNED